MGCQISNEEEKDEKYQEQSNEVERNTTKAMTSKSPAVTDFKSRLEWKLCVAKDTPEPEFDLSNCNLKDVPSGVFVLCRVLLKERLKLQENQLQSLNGGGSLNDLRNLQELNLNYNRFTQLPQNICNILHNLRELSLSHNYIETLPQSLNKLNNLEFLDISHNIIRQINEIACMPKLRILNISGNIGLTHLPKNLSTCDSLVDLVLDAECIVYPPANIIENGTAEIINYLTVHDENPITIEALVMQKSMQNNVKKITANLISIERERDIVAGINLENDKATREKRFMDHERLEQEKYSNLEAALHQQQMIRKRDLLQHLLKQQVESDSLIQKMQMEKGSERLKLIDDILKAEQNAGMIVDKLISLKCGPDPALLEKEFEEQQQLLEQLRIDHDDLRKRDIVAAMAELLEHETKQIEIYNENRQNTSKTLLEYENNSNQLLNILFKSNDKDRLAVVSKVTQNEELQKAAFAKLIEKNDARTWGLVEQVRIVESQLATMTNCEIERKKLQLDGQIVDLSEQRVRLTYILLDLLDQQTKRKKELFDTLICLEQQKEKEQQDFWLLQYQKLLDSQPCELSFKSSTIDPLLGYNFLVNGVVHCIPFLSKLWQSNKCNIADITHKDLSDAGIKCPIDRQKIIKSISDFKREKQTKECVPPPDLDHHTHQPSASFEEHKINVDEPSTDLASECVICMEDTCKVIFLPCGHLCCCLNCQNTIDVCPMCRATIERRIKIIQS